ncbi:MAG: DUF1501 domain-containing protein [Verrucomicrobiales bacterium]
MPARRPFCPGPIRRRSFLQIGSLGALGLGLGDFLKMEAAAKSAGSPLRDTSVIFIWLPGGPPHLETYDMKPAAPSEYRGIFKPIPTNVSGIEVCELLPLHAKIADKFNLIRSIHHEFADHGGGHKRFMTGRDPREPTGFVNDAPAVTSVVAKKLAPSTPDGLPTCVAGVDRGRTGIDTFSLGPAYLGPSHVPFIVGGDPSEPDFQVQNIGLERRMEDRLEDRLALLGGMDKLRRDIDASGMMGSMDSFNRQALDMLTSPKVRDAFDLSKEPDRVRDRYGRHPYGQRGLMARRLVEAGCRFVTMVWEKPFPQIPKNCTYNWDSHAVNCHIFDDLKWRLPPYDQALTALIEDLYARGLDKKVLLIATGEFGRTPKIETRPGTQTGVEQPGRDHWPQAMSMLVSGGGMRTGQVIGATNAKGEHPAERPLTPNDLWATAYQHLGIDFRENLLDFQGRPNPILPFGEPIKELLPAGA